MTMIVNTEPITKGTLQKLNSSRHSDALHCTCLLGLMSLGYEQNRAITFIIFAYIPLELRLYQNFGPTGPDMTDI